MPEDSIPFFQRDKKPFKPLEELYKQYVRNDPMGPFDQQVTMEKMINIGFPILGWGAPPEIIGSKAFFRDEKQKKQFVREGEASAKISFVFQAVLAKLLERGLLDVEYETE